LNCTYYCLANPKGWNGVKDRCTKYGVTIIPIEKDKLISNSITQPIAFAMPRIEEEIILLVAENGAKSSLSEFTANSIWGMVEQFYANPALWMIVPKHRDFAMVRDISLRHCL
ncbi:MAG: hypothetical protein M3Y27_26775, partial [Acidobacteriota bacterium]|nr:hypothetical protein [Acidobacteriota bacterium]